MFKKYNYTCPDMIHARNVQKKIAYANIGVMAVFYGGLWAAANAAQNKEKNLKNFDTSVE